ncbi:MAG TPA: hypothetical protein GXX55_05365 [Firmicutes bacterium]|nr:hypothetical protein [Bacillota bacterium]
MIGTKAMTYDVLLIFLLGGLLYLPWVNLPTTDADTAYYSSAAQRVVDSGDWMTLRSSEGNLLDKPPLSIWLMAISYRLWGRHDWSTRLWQIILSLGTLVLTYLTARRFFGRKEALFGTLILATTLLFFYCTMVVQQDILNLFTYALFFYALVRFWQTHAPAAFYLGWLALSLSFLNRWQIALITPLGVLVAWVAVARILGRDDFQVRKLFGSREVALRRTLLGLLIFAVAGGTWYLYEYLRLGRPFLELFFGRRNLSFLQNPGGRPFSWLNATYLPQLVLASIPWVIFLPDAVATVTKEARRWAELRNRESDGFLFLAVWFLVAFLVPHGSAWRVIRYLLPTLPPLAILMGVSITRKLQARRGFALSAAMSGVMSLLFLLIDVYILAQRLDAGLEPYKDLILPFSLASTLIFTSYTIAISCRRERFAIFLFILFTVTSYVALFASVNYRWDQISPWRSLGLEARARLGAGIQLAWYRAEEKLPYGIPGEEEKAIYEYYAGRPVLSIGRPDELGRMLVRGPVLVVARDRTLFELKACHPEVELQTIRVHRSGWTLVRAERRD